MRPDLNRIGQITLLTAEEEVALAKRIEARLFATIRLREMVSMSADERDPLPAQLRRDLRQIAHEGQRATTQLVEANLRLVVSLARRYIGRGMPFLDLIQEGNMGLIRAVEKFDYTQGYKFSTYASWWIHQAITRAVADQGRTVRLPVQLVEMINRLGQVHREMPAPRSGRVASTAASCWRSRENDASSRAPPRPGSPR